MNDDSPPIAVVKQTHLSRPPAPHSGTVATVSVALLLLTSVAYWLDLGGCAGALPAAHDAVFCRGEYWRAATAILVHSDLRHLGANAIVFGLLAYLVFGYYGPLVYPLLVWALGAVANVLALATYPANTALVGASGVVYLMAGLWLTLYLLLERRLGCGKRLVRALGFALIVLAPTTLEPSVSHRTHAIGFGLGVVLAAAYFWARRDALRRSEQVVWE